MAYEILGNSIGGVEAAADLSSTGQHRFVTMGATGVDLTGAGLRVDGALHNSPVAGAAASVASVGSIVKVSCSAAIARGASVASAANGQAVTATTGNYIAGIALEATGAAGELCSVFFCPMGISA